MAWVIILEVLKQLGIWVGLILFLVLLWVIGSLVCYSLDRKGKIKSASKSPCFIEWNEEFLNKLSPEARAEYEKALKAHKQGKC